MPLSVACSLLLATRSGRRLLYVGRVEMGREPGEVARLRENAPGAQDAGVRGLKRK